MGVRVTIKSIIPVFTMLAAGGWWWWWWWWWAQLADCRCNSVHYTNVTVEGVLLSAAQIILYRWQLVAGRGTE